jgi:hypothetical protein
MKPLLLFSLLLTLQLTPAHADLDPYFTRNFPDPDRAEITPTVYGSQPKPPDAKLDAKQAQQLAAMLRSQKWWGPAPNCDKPQYILRFYSGNKLIAADQICFFCGCFAPISSDLHALGPKETFDPETPQAKKMQAFLKGLFP